MLADLDPGQVSGLKAAIANARAYSANVIEILRRNETPMRAGAVTEIA